MGLLLAGGATWLLLTVLVLSFCRAATRADRSRRNRCVAVAAVTVATTLPSGSAQAASCGATARLHETEPEEARRSLACEIDRVRERRGREPLRGDRRLSRAADRHADDMVGRGYFAHDSPGGGSVRERLTRTGYISGHCRWRVGEVLAWSTGSRSSARATVRAWLRSGPHRRIVLSRRYDEVGVGLRAGTPRGDEAGITAVAVLGKRRCSA